MQEAEVARRLADVEFFAGLSEAKRRAIASKMVEMRHNSGRVLTEQGTEGASFHLILDGTAVVEVGGEPRATLGQGAGFGEISLIDGQPRSATVTAGEGGLTTAALSSLAFAPLLDDPEVAQGLLRVVTARLRAAEARESKD